MTLSGVDNNEPILIELRSTSTSCLRNRLRDRFHNMSELCGGSPQQERVGRLEPSLRELAVGHKAVRRRGAGIMGRSGGGGLVEVVEVVGWVFLFII